MPVAYPVFREAACTVLPGIIVVYEEFQPYARALRLQSNLIVALGQQYAVL